MVITNNNQLMTFGGWSGDSKQCYKLGNSKCQKQSPLIQRRRNAVAITMADGIYVLGGSGSPLTSDFLPNGLCEWQVGPSVPNPGIREGHGVAISKTDFLLVGGSGTYNRILKYNIESRTFNWQWTEIGSLLQGREDHRCFFHGGKVVVTGGYFGGYLKSTEIINISDGTSRKAGDLNVARSHLGMGIAHINGKSKLIVFGGETGHMQYTDSIDEWDDESETWTMSSMKLSEAKRKFGYCQLP